MRATMSILGLHNFTNGAVWDELTLPEGIDRDTVIGNILLDCAELEVIYPDPDIMTSAIGLWSAAERDSWKKLYETTQFDYNPIWNKDGTVTETENTSRLHKELGGDQESENSTQLHKELGGDNETSNESFSSEGSSSRTQADAADQVTQVSAYDASTFQNRDKNMTEAESTEHVVADNANTTDRATDRTVDRDNMASNDRLASRQVDRDNMDVDDRYYERRETGNIGVTTTQQMIMEEREVDKFHIDDYIVNSFKRRFCLLVY